jgi:hypothetical protein
MYLDFTGPSIKLRLRSGIRFGDPEMRPPEIRSITVPIPEAPPAPDMRRRVSVRGSILVPTTWGSAADLLMIDSLEVHFLTGAVGGSTPFEVTVPEGPHIFGVQPMHWFVSVDVREGMDPLRLVVPEPTRVDVTAIDATNGEPIPRATV